MTAPGEHLIQKKVLHPGKLYIPIPTGSRVHFHFQTKRADTGAVVDDSRKMGEPMELVFGKKFKFEVWEAVIQKMSLDEVAQFRVDKSLCTNYPFLSKTLRDIHKKPEERRHCCGMTLQNEGIGYGDLDELMANPTDLVFIIELTSVELPHQYEKQSWQMSDEEKLRAINSLRATGNLAYAEGDYVKAQEYYGQAISIVDYFMGKEKPHDVEWNEFAQQKVPLLLNYAQCRLLDKDYYFAIEMCKEALKLDANNVKALFRRGRAYVGAWNPVEARKDFEKALELDPKLKGAIDKELKILAEKQKERDLEDKKNLHRLF